MSLDRALIPTFRTQFGLVNRSQVHAAGGTDEHIEYRLRCGRWVRFLPRTYCLAGVPDTWEQRVLGACLWAGSTAAASHRSAARLWGLDGIKEQVVEVASERVLRSPAEWLIVHRPMRLGTSEVAQVGRTPATVVSRTILDLGAVVSRKRVEIALDGALRDGLLEYEELRAVLNLHAARGRDGSASLRYLLTERDPEYVPPESALERAFVPLLEDPRLPAAVRQFAICDGGRIIYRIDFAYPTWKVAVEIDGYRHHYGRQSWHKDRTRSNVLTVRGWRVLRFAQEDAARAEYVVHAVSEALRRAGCPI